MPGCRGSGKSAKNYRKTSASLRASNSAPTSIASSEKSNQRITTDSALQPFVTNYFTRLPCGCQRGIRIGSVKDGKVMYFIPPPVPPDPKMQPPIGIVVDGNGTVYAASDDQKDIKKYVKN